MARSNVENKGTKRPTIFMYVRYKAQTKQLNWARTRARESSESELRARVQSEQQETVNCAEPNIAQGTRRPSHEKKNHRPTRQDVVCNTMPGTSSLLDSSIPMQPKFSCKLRFRLKPSYICSVRSELNRGGNIQSGNASSTGVASADISIFSMCPCSQGALLPQL
jgi:hypothetical protein